jgi:serine/threonine protein kinase
MTQDTTTQKPGPPVSLLLLLSEVSDRFEESWRAGQSPRIEKYLEEFSTSERPEALRHLVALEIDLRRLAGEDPDSEEYRERFTDQVGSEPGETETFSPGNASQGRPFPFLAPPEEPDELGRLGGFRVLSVLGKGGMAIVFRAWDTVLKREVALKVVRPEFSHDELYRHRFLSEARAAGTVKSDHVVRIYQVGEDRGVLFLIMDLLEGETLGDRLKRLRILPPAEVARIGREVAEGLAAAHGAGLIHRDIKPSNLWLETLPDPAAPARVRILDFGLVRQVRPHESLSERGQIVGTPEYMSPEQVLGEPRLDPRTDLFSLGVVLYLASTGVRPFWRPALTAILTAVTHHHPVSPHEAAGDCPYPLSDLIGRLLSKDREGRPPSARDLVEELRLLQSLIESDEPSFSDPIPYAGASTKAPVALDLPDSATIGRRRWIVALVTAALTLAATTAGISHLLRPTPGHNYKGSVNVILVEQQGQAVYRKLTDLSALPVRSGDCFRIEASVHPEAYVYLFWITAEGAVKPIYPWTAGRWGTRPAREKPVTATTLPTNVRSAYTFTGQQTGMESLVLLARADPLPLDDNAIQALFAGIVPQNRLSDGHAVVWFDDGKVVEDDPHRTRRGFDETPTNHIVLQMLDVLQRRLGPHAAYTTAVAFAKGDR